MNDKKSDLPAAGSMNLKLNAAADADVEKLMAEVSVSPHIQAAFSITRLFEAGNFQPVELAKLVEELASQAKAATEGKLTRAEATLAVQAHTLDVLFNELLRRGTRNLAGGYVDVGERYTRLALKAQSQCKATLESLSALKSPRPIAYVRQTNIAAGPQQVNNGSGEVQDLPEQILEDERGKRMDTGAQSSSGQADSRLEALGALNGPEKP